MGRSRAPPSSAQLGGAPVTVAVRPVHLSAPLLGVDEALVLVGVLAAPLASVLPSVAGRVGPGEAFFAASFVVALGMRRDETVTALRENPLLWPVIALTALLALSAVLGETGVHGALQAMGLAFYLLVGLPLITHYPRLPRLMWAVLAGVVLFDALSVLTAAAGFSFLAWDAGSGRFRTLITPVGALGASATALTGYFAAATFLRFRLWSAVGLALCVLTVFYDQSRTSMLAVVVILLLVGAASQMQRSRTLRFAGLQKTLYAAVGLIAIALVVFVLSRSDRLAEQLAVIATSGSLESADLVRTLGYREAITAVMSNPWLGPGLGTIRDPLFDQVVHNAYLQLAADVSVFATVALLLMLGRALQLVWRQVRWTLRTDQTDDAIFSLAALGVIVAVAVRFLFHPLGVVLGDWIHFMVAFSAFGVVHRTGSHAAV